MMPLPVTLEPSLDVTSSRRQQHEPDKETAPGFFIDLCAGDVREAARQAKGLTPILPVQSTKYNGQYDILSDADIDEILAGRETFETILAGREYIPEQEPESDVQLPRECRARDH